jgi:hypothetical protein
VTESIRRDLFGTTPSVTESTMVDDDGVFRLTIDTSSPSGTDLFPGGLTDLDGHPLKDACFTIGIDDPLSWPELDDVSAATIELFRDGVTQSGPMLITDRFSSPWDGFLDVALPNVAGAGVNQVHVVIQLTKSASPPANDDCANAIALVGESTPYTNIGSTTDGPPEPLDCGHAGDTDVGSDVWFEYVANCSGDLTIDVCSATYDTRMALYDGCGACPPPRRPIACNDDTDFCGTFGNRSRITVPTTVDECYTVRVGGFFGDQGTGFVRVACDPGACCVEGGCVDDMNATSCAGQGGEWFAGRTCSEFVCPGAIPENDECVDCIPLATDQPYMGTTVGATGDRTSSCASEDTADVWHCWTADCTGRARFSLCGSAFDTTLSVFDACDGSERVCNDDACPSGSFASAANLSVVSGETYYVRVSGFNGDRGDYTLNVEPCTAEPQACCLPSPSCFPMNPEFCVSLGGEPRGVGSTCVTDLNDNGVDDACEFCPSTVTIASSTPPYGTVDARQPHRPEAIEPRQGIGSPGGEDVPREPIVVQLSPPIPAAIDCFDFCETQPDDVSGANGVASVVDVGGGRYEIVLDLPISTHAMSFIEYTSDGSRVALTSHPGNVDGNGVVNRDDLFEFIGCCLQGFCLADRTEYICDIDHSGGIAPPDLLAIIDLYGGAATFDIWNGTPLPGDSGCP